VQRSNCQLAKLATSACVENINPSVSALSLTAHLTLISSSECTADEAASVTVEEAEKFLTATETEDEKKMEMDAADEPDNLVCRR